jgi:indole-3-glycerol phosphate synthase
MSETVLDQIMAAKRDEVAACKLRRPLVDVRRDAEAADAPRDFFAALSGGGAIRAIAEVKKASPSAGVIRADFDPVAIARSYESHGAAAISVLTDEPFFQGRLEYLAEVRRAVSIPVLRKDFVLDEYQVVEARAAGADAVLLIAECLDDCRLRALHNAIVEWGMTPLVELYDPENLPRVLEAGATVVGVNNRDLRTFVVDLGHSLRLRPKVPRECVFVSESGIADRGDVERLEAAGVDAILVGESLMRQRDPGVALAKLLA